MKKLIIPFLAVIMLSCDNLIDNRTECQKENIGYFAFSNTSSDAYDIFINGTYYDQQPGKSISKNWIKFPAGKSYTIKVQQVSGYILYPTVKTYTITLNQCDEKKVTFP